MAAPQGMESARTISVPDLRDFLAGQVGQLETDAHSIRRTVLALGHALVDRLERLDGGITPRVYVHTADVVLEQYEQDLVAAGEPPLSHERRTTLRSCFGPILAGLIDAHFGRDVSQAMREKDAATAVVTESGDFRAHG